MKALFLSLLLILSLEAKERIVSLSPSLTEIIFALGLGDEVVGVSSYSLYPKEATKLPIVGSYTNPVLEKVIALSPTVVIGQKFNDKSLRDIEKFHIKTIKVSLQSIKEIKESIALLAQRFSKTDKGDKLIKEINKAVKNAKKSQNPHSVLIVYGLKEDLRTGIYVAGHNIFFNDIIEITGNTNAYRQNTTSQPVLNYENIIAINPQQIIILYSKKSNPNVDVKKALKNWYNLPTDAARDGRISIVDEDYIHIPSHRISKTIQRLSQETATLAPKTSSKTSYSKE
jgi:iron complex transport system substrate-binding protein